MASNNIHRMYTLIPPFFKLFLIRTQITIIAARIGFGTGAWNLFFRPVCTLILEAETVALLCVSTVLGNSLLIRPSSFLEKELSKLHKLTVPILLYLPKLLH